MTDNIATCPKCGSEKTRYIEKAQEFFCKECDHEFAVVNEIVNSSSKRKLKIFLSYGHDRNEELILMVKKDLEARGHDVWFDKNEIKYGDDWRCAITDGILQSDRMLSFLSRHSTREPGVCLDEIGIALGVKGGVVSTILVESEEEVVPPVSVSHLQWLDMHDWKSRRATAGFDQWYQEKFNDILRVVESEENRRFAGEIEHLKSRLKPVSMDSFTARLLQRKFTGREWLVDEMREWMADPTSGRVFVLTGEPGIGKSAFSAWLSHYNKVDMLAVAFIRYNQPSSSDPCRIIRSLAFQIATRLPDYRKLLMGLAELDSLDSKNADELFSYLLTEPMRYGIDGGRRKAIVLIDALDESQEGMASVADLLARYAGDLPSWLKVVATTRPEAAIVGILSHLHPHTLHADDARNRQDLTEYIRSELAEFEPDGETVDAIVGKSEGIFIYAVHVCEDLKRGNLSLQRLNEFPTSLGGIYADYFKRRFPDGVAYLNAIAPALQTVLAAVEAVPGTELETVLCWSETKVHGFMLSLGTLFTETDRGIEPFHRSLAEWLTDSQKAGPYFISLKDGHRRLATAGWCLVESLFDGKGGDQTLRYSQRYVGVHLYASGMFGELDRLVKGVACLMSEEEQRCDEIIGNLLDWVVSKEIYGKETVLKCIINSFQKDALSLNLAKVFYGKAEGYERTGATLWAQFLFEKIYMICEELVRREPERTDFKHAFSQSLILVGRVNGSFGEREKSLECYQQALAIMEELALREPERTDFKQELSISLFSVGDAHNALSEGQMVHGYYQQALAIIAELAERQPERTDFKHTLSISLSRVGGIHRKLGEGEKALEYYQQALAIREELVVREPERTDFKHALSDSLSSVGVVYEALAEGEKALGYYQQALAIMGELVGREPERTDFKRGLSSYLTEVGRIHKALGEGEKALEYYQQAIVIREELVVREPERTDFKQGLSLSLISLGRVYVVSGEGEKALECYQQALAIREELVVREPERTDFKYDLSDSLYWVGGVYESLGEREKALECYQQALAILGELVVREPERTDFKCYLTDFFFSLGEVHESLGEGEMALECYQQALAIMEELAGCEPERTDFKYGLSIFLSKVGRGHESLDEREKALEYYQQALAIMEELVGREPEMTNFKHAFSEFLILLGRVHESLDEGEKALEYYQQALANMEELVRREPDRTDFKNTLLISLSKVDRVHESLDAGEKALECYQQTLANMEELVGCEPERSDLLEKTLEVTRT